MSDAGIDILAVVETVSTEKGIEREIIFDALEVALAAATRKNLGGDADVRIAINRDTGAYETFRRWLVMADDDPEFQSPDGQILVSTAQQRDPKLEIGDYIEEPIDSVDIGRISAHTAKQVIVQESARGGTGADRGSLRRQGWRPADRYRQAG